MKKDKIISDATIGKDSLYVIHNEDGVELRIKFDGNKDEKAFFLSKVKVEKLISLLLKG